jgi:hypothetical protein
MQPERVNGSQSKIPHGNLAYISKSTKSPSLLTRSKTASYIQAIGLRNRVRNRSENTKRCLARPRARSMTKIRPKNNSYPHSHFTEHLTCAFEKLPRESNLNHKILSHPMTQELYQLLPAIIHPLQHNTILQAQHNLRTQAATGTKFDLLSLKTTTKIFLCGRTEVTSVAAHRNQLKTHKNDSRKRS